ncbi:MAG TPA: hypothetical protein VHY37_04075 [Tepidisphaeraceae bacterium]|nr:hypothetical protein [Tepidisphaeraceae bacterium]
MDLTINAPTIQNGGQIATASFNNGTKTDKNGYCSIHIVGVAKGTTPLTVSPTNGGTPDTKTITVVDPAITFSLNQLNCSATGGPVQVVVTVQGGNFIQSGVQLKIDSPTAQDKNASAAFVNGDTTGSDGGVTVQVQGKTQGNTTLKIEAVQDGQTPSSIPINVTK